MRKIITRIHQPITVFVFILTAMCIVLGAHSVHADARGSGGRDSVRAPQSSSTPTAPSIVVPISIPAPSSAGGISNTTAGTVHSGSNTGGDVITGDESVSVHVINEGPTNANTIVISQEADQEEESPALPPSSCPGRLTECAHSVRGR